MRAKTEDVADIVKKTDIVYFWRQNDWGLYGRRSEMVVRELASREEVGSVFYLEPPISPYAAEGRHKLSKLIPITAKRENSRLTRLILVNCASAVAWAPKVLVRANDLFLILAAKLYLALRGVRRPILWVCPPHRFAELLIKCVSYRRLICDCIDDVTAYSNRTRKAASQIQGMYSRCLIRAHVVFATSKTFEEKLRKYNKNTIYIANASDSSLFARVAHGKGRKGRCGLREIGSPILGYIGTLSERTDTDLIRYVARKRPEWQILLIGYVHASCDIEKIRGLKNVHSIGRAPYTELPHYMESIDVCIMPHEDGELSRSMSPLKLYQYLSSGRPVVSTAVEGVDYFRDVVFVSEDYASFLENIERALSEDNKEKKMERILRAKENSWKIRVGEMWCHVCSEG